MFGNLWNRLTGGRRRAAAEHDAEAQKLSADERRHVEESADELESDELAGEVLGGIHPDRLLGDGRPNPEDEPPR